MAYDYSMLQGLSFDQDPSIMGGIGAPGVSSSAEKKKGMFDDPDVQSAGITAAAGLAASLAKQAQERQMMKIQNELLRRKNLQASIEQGTTGIQQAQNQNMQNLARAFLK